MKLAVDFANFTPIPTQAQLECLKANGYGRAVIGCAFGTVAALQLAACEAAGLEVEAYAWLEFQAQWQQKIDRTLYVIAQHPVRRIWLDCEAPAAEAVTVVPHIRKAIEHVRQQRPDLEVGIYTANWWWGPHTGDSHAFTDLPLWLAAYTEDPRRVPEPKDVPLFGGWSQAAMWQYAWTIETCGLNTDRNLILDEPMGPTKEEFGALFAYAVETRQALEAIVTAVLVPLSQGNTTVAQQRLKYIYAVAGKPWPGV